MPPVPKVFGQTVRLADREFRQLFIKDLGHEAPTIVLSNDRKATAKALRRFRIVEARST